MTRVQTALVDQGHLTEDDVTGYGGTRMVQATEEFQKKQGDLVVDGRIRPGGPTETALAKAVTEPGAQPAAQSSASQPSAAAQPEAQLKEAEAAMWRGGATAAEQARNITTYNALKEQQAQAKPAAGKQAVLAPNNDPFFSKTRQTADVIAAGLKAARARQQAGAQQIANALTVEQPLDNDALAGYDLAAANADQAAENDYQYSTRAANTPYGMGVAKAVNAARQARQQAQQYMTAQPRRNWLDDAVDELVRAGDQLYTDATSWHFEDRDHLNAPLPRNAQEAIEMGFERYPDWQSVEHQNQRGSPEVKYGHPDGREVVFDGDTGEVVTDARTKGTYNYVTPPSFDPNNWNYNEVDDLALYGAGHLVADWLPYRIAGNRRGEN